MKAVVWHAKEDVRVDDVPDPVLQEPTDAIIRITSTAICGSDLHLYKGLIPFGMGEGDILGHEPMGIVEEIGSEVTHIRPGDRVVIPANISCGSFGSRRRITDRSRSLRGSRARCRWMRHRGAITSFRRSKTVP